MRTLLLFLGVIGPCAAQVAPLRILVPAYFYPSAANRPAWQALADAHDPAKGIELVVIVNFNSGQPPKQADPNYTQVINLLHAKGVHLLTYVSARYGKTPLDDIRTALTQYTKLHPGKFGGIFLDEQEADGQRIKDYYAPIRAHAMTLYPTKAAAPESKGKPIVVTNPGTVCASEFVTERRVADVVMIHENAESGATALTKQMFPAWLQKERPERFAALAHTCSDLPTFARTARTQNAAYIFATDAPGPPTNANCWDRLPKDWLKLCAEVRRLNAGK